MDDAVKQKFDHYPDHIRPKMEAIRSLIYEVAETTEGVDQITETLKWSEPAYLTSKPKSGTTIRIDWKERAPDQIGVYVNCNTSLVETWRTMFSEELDFEGTRAMLLPVNQPLPENPLRICIQMALRYHLDK
ncbi:MAG TPA: hypothetical protein DEQ34_06830 [Balneolaceae bacterium]|nr:hypothetical protein [Balneolaceae bacterium]|tara:strand:+ start:12054 stop:12449 length:396 start_codon:yes stop_codon:yes gene_type:complete